MKLKTVFFWKPAVFQLPRSKKGICIKNTTVSEEHQIQEILAACTKNVNWFDYFLPKLKSHLKNKIKAIKDGPIPSKIQ